MNNHLILAVRLTSPEARADVVTTAHVLREHAGVVTTAHVLREYAGVLTTSPDQGRGLQGIRGAEALLQIPE